MFLNNISLTSSEKRFLGLQLLHIRAAQPLIIFTLKDCSFLSSLSLIIVNVNCRTVPFVDHCSLSRISKLSEVLCGHTMTCIKNTHSLIKSQKWHKLLSTHKAKCVFVYNLIVFGNVTV